MRTLLTYSVGCFVLLQVIDILQQPLGLPSASIRWLILIILALAPLLIGTVAWLGFRAQQLGSERGSAESGQVLFQFGTATLDTASRRIAFNGETAEVQPKVFDLIEYLLRARDRVVSKDELFDEIWPSVVVSEASLTQSIKRARDLFRQHGFEEDVIRTVSRKGYQFDYPVTASAASPPQTRPSVGKLVVLPTAIVTAISLGLGLAILQREDASPDYPPSDINNHSLAVLPFSNLSADAEFSYFSDGLTETITNSLTRVRGLRVIATASSFRLRDADEDLGELGRQLRIGYLVQGSVQQANEQLRITARLVRVQDGTQLWSHIFNRQLDDVFSVHDDIARAVAQQMAAILAASLNLPAAAPTLTKNSNDSEAYRLLLRSRALRKSPSSDSLQTADSLLRQALQLKPNYAEALVALADVNRLRATRGDLPREKAFSDALKLARNALAINPELSDALIQIGEIQHRHFWEFEGAAETYQRAIELNPGSAPAHSAYSRFLAKSGDQETAVKEARIALDLNPLSVNAPASLTIRLIRANDLPAARQMLDNFKGRHPDHADTPWLETNWHIRAGSYNDALQWVALEELDYLRLSLGAVALHKLGRIAQAEEALAELVATDAEGAAFQIAEVYAQWQQPDKAFEWLDRAYSQGDPGIVELYSSVNLASLYSDARFPKLADRIGLPPPPAQF